MNELIVSGYLKLIDCVWNELIVMHDCVWKELIVMHESGT